MPTKIQIIEEGILIPLTILNYLLIFTSSPLLRMVNVSLMQFVLIPKQISLTSTTINLAKIILSTLLKVDMVVLNLSYMAKSKVKTDYIEELCDITRQLAQKLTVKELRQLLAKHAHS